MAEKIVIQLEADTSKANKSIDGVEKNVQDTNEGLDGINSRIDQFTGGAITAFKSFVAGAKAGVRSMGALKLAVAATGIGALLIAITSLSQFFTRTEKGAQTLRVIMAGLGQVVDEVADIFVKIGETLMGVFTDPLQAVKDLGKAITGFLTDPIGTIETLAEGASDFAVELERDVRAAIELQNALNGVKVAERELLIDRAKANKALVEARFIGQDLTKSNEERIEALQKAAEIEDGILQKELAIAREKLRIQVEQNALASSNEEALQAEAELQARIIDLQTQSTQAQIRLNTTLSGLRKQEEVASQKALQEFEKGRIEALEKIRVGLLNANEKEIDDVRQKYEELIELARKFGQDTVELERLRQLELERITNPELEGVDPIQAKVDREVAAVQEGEQRKLAIRKESESVLSGISKERSEESKQLTRDEAQAKLSVYGALASAIAGLAGEQTAAGKAAALAAAIINTYQGITAALSQTTDITPTQTLRFANAAAVGIAGFAAVKNILKTKVPGGGGGGAGAGGGAPSAPRPPSVGSSIGLINPNEQGNNIGTSITQGLNDKPIKAYVTPSDVISGTDLENKVRSNAQFE